MLVKTIIIKNYESRETVLFNFVNSKPGFLKILKKGGVSFFVLFLKSPSVKILCLFEYFYFQWTPRLQFTKLRIKHTSSSAIDFFFIFYWKLRNSGDLNAGGPISKKPLITRVLLSNIQMIRVSKWAGCQTMTWTTGYDLDLDTGVLLIYLLRVEG